ncbi:GNAT family N-acetyltransferase [Planktomarina temperata]|nr:GNAT family N-acetyltransferase [Planktomarina temperata]
MSIPLESVLKGSFVCLQPLRVDDAEITFGWRHSDRAKLLNMGAQTLDQQRSWIASRPESERNFIITLQSGDPIGMLSLGDIDLVNSRAEPGRFLIGEEEKVRGIPVAAEAMFLLYQFAFEQCKLRRLFGKVASDNRRMIKWQLFMGMQKEGCLRQHYFIDGHFQDAIIFGLLEEEYRKVATPRLQAMIKAGHHPAVH